MEKTATSPVDKPDKLLRFCAELFRTPVGALSEDSGPDSVENWDSLATMDMLAGVEEQFGVSLSLSVAARLESIGELRQALRSRGVNDV
jgi:acyl carrier protein